MQTQPQIIFAGNDYSHLTLSEIYFEIQATIAEVADRLERESAELQAYLRETMR